MTIRRTAWFNCAAGVAGDMMLGALLDAGADLDCVRELLADLNLDGWTLITESVARSGIKATKAHVHVTDDATSRTWSDIKQLLETSALPERVRARSLTVILGLASAEAALHGVAIDDVHFHEVGGHDALIDIVGSIAALEVLGIDEIACSPIGLGRGVIRADHGLLPAPAPATLSLLQGFEVHGLDQQFESATPTGAALLAGLAGHSSAIPGMTVLAQGFGAGTRDLAGVANVVGVLIGERPDSTTEQLGLIETNLDDITGEHLAHALQALLDEGAADAWVTPITMKKGRPAHLLSVLCHPSDLPRLGGKVRELTGSLGVRSTLVARTSIERRIDIVDVLGHPVRIKVSPISVKPEFDDVAAVAKATGQPLSEIDRLARAIFSERSSE